MTALATVEHLPARYLALSAGYDPALVAQLKTAPGCFWHPGLRQWIGPEEAMMPVLERLQKAGVIILNVPAREVRYQMLPGFDATGLFGYQIDGVAFLNSALHEFGSALLADTMGLGKSCQALRASAAHTSFIRGERLLILCPAVVGPHWAEQADRWLGCKVARLYGPATKKRAEARKQWANWGGIGICSYDSFRSLYKDLPTSELIILDELHYLSSPTAKRSKAVRAYIDRHTTRPKLIGLTGTPITARPVDMWHPLDLLFPNPVDPKRDGRFGKQFNFGLRYCAGHQEEIKGLPNPVWNFKGASNLEELGARLRSGLMLRREKSEIEGLPARTRVTLPVELPARAAAALARVSATIDSHDSVGRMLSAIEEHKIQAAIDLAKDLLDDGHRVLLFTLRKASAKELGETLNAPYVTGDDPVEKRRPKLLSSNCGVATIYSMTTGIDLTEFDTVIFVGLDWVPSTMLQAEGRAHRIGSKRDVTFYYLIGLQTLDEVVRGKVIERLDQFEQIVGNAQDEAAMRNALQGNKSEADLLAEIFEQVRSQWEDQ